VRGGHQSLLEHEEIIERPIDENDEVRSSKPARKRISSSIEPCKHRREEKQILNKIDKTSKIPSKSGKKRWTSKLHKWTVKPLKASVKPVKASLLNLMRSPTDEEEEEVLRKCVKTCLEDVFKRAEYAALKVIAFSFATGLHIAASEKALSSEQHGILISSEEVIYFCEGGITSCSWVAFLQKYPYWRTVGRPADNLVAAEVAARAQRELVNPLGFGDYSSVLNNSEHFASYCYSGIRSSNDLRSSAAGATAGMALAAGGANLAFGISTATETTYIAGLIPMGTVTTFSAATFAGVATGLVVAGFVVAPLTVKAYRYFVQCQDLPVAFINDTAQQIYVKAYPSVQAELVEPSSLVEISPAVGSADEFELSIYKSRFDWASSGTLTVRRGQVVRYCDDAYHIVPRGCLPAYAPE